MGRHWQVSHYDVVYSSGALSTISTFHFKMNFKMNQHRAMNDRSANHWVARMCSSCCLIMNPSSCSYQFYFFFFFFFFFGGHYVRGFHLMGQTRRVWHRDIWLKAYQLIISRDWSKTAQTLLGRLTMTNTEREWRAVRLTRLTSMSRRFTFGRQQRDLWWRRIPVMEQKRPAIKINESQGKQENISLFSFLFFFCLQFSSQRWVSPLVCAGQKSYRRT